MHNTSEPPKIKLVTEVWGIFKSLANARRNILSIIPEIATTQPIVSGKLGWVRWHMVMEPSALRQILLEKLDRYPKSDVTKNLLGPAIGNSMFIAEGAHWRWQRRAAAPVFSARNISNLGPVMTASAEATSDRLSAGDGIYDLYQEMVKSTFDVISNVTFSGSGRLNSDEVQKAIDAYIEQVAKVSLFDVVGLPTWVPRPSRIFQPNTLKKTKAIADMAIHDRAQHGAKPTPDLLDLLMAGEDPETKRTMNPIELRDNLLTFIVAGHETTALTLSWALFLCAFDPTVQDKLRAEANAVLNGRTATADDCPNLPYSKQVINEALRLYPPAALVSRTAQSDDTICGREVRKGDTVMIPIYALHRHHDLWPNPNQFDPDRFADGGNFERFAFLPFGDGPRVCIGAQFAITEAQIILATLIDRFSFEIDESTPAPDPVMVLTLRPEGGVRLRVQKI